MATVGRCRTWARLDGLTGDDGDGDGDGATLAAVVAEAVPGAAGAGLRPAAEDGAERLSPHPASATRAAPQRVRSVRDPVVIPI